MCLNMKTLFGILGVAALICGCSTNKDTGGTATTTYDSGYGSNVQTNTRAGSSINKTNYNSDFKTNSSSSVNP